VAQSRGDPNPPSRQGGRDQRPVARPDSDGDSCWAIGAFARTRAATHLTCIAGPCPFTRVDTDGFSVGGHDIEVLIRNGPDTTTFVLQAEVFRTQVGDIVRESAPVIFGRAMNFTLPAKAEGPSIEAEMNGSRIVFPLRPTRRQPRWI
jgi:hypothetical protein